MALVDDPREMILRMFHLQSREGFEDACKVFPEGLTAPERPFGDDDLVFGVFKERHRFSQRGVATKGKDALRWSEIVRSSLTYSGGKDILLVEGRSGARVRIDLSSATGKRPAYRLQQLVDGLAGRWSEAAYTGLPAMSIENFFAKAKRPHDFAVNLFPEEPRPPFREAFLELRARDEVVDVQMLPSDPEDEGRVYAEEIAVISSQPANFFDSFVNATRASEIAPASENDQRKLGLDTDEPVWIVSWR
jgi:hypothetical protein